jgi:hypothetical protein
VMDSRALGETPIAVSTPALGGRHKLEDSYSFFVPPAALTGHWAVDYFPCFLAISLRGRVSISIGSAAARA